jgi:hypothetical protein
MGQIRKTMFDWHGKRAAKRKTKPLHNNCKFKTFLVMRYRQRMRSASMKLAADYAMVPTHNKPAS